MTESIFTTQTPAVHDANDHVHYTMATLFTPSVNGQVTGVRWWWPVTDPSQTPIGLLYSRTDDSSGTELARKSFVGIPVNDTWNSFVFDTPVDVTAGSYYYAAIWTYDHYVATGGFFAPGGAGQSGVTNGHLTAPADDTTTPRRNGRFNDTNSLNPAYPNTQFNGGLYFIDVLFTPSGAPASTPGYWGVRL